MGVKEYVAGEIVTLGPFDEFVNALRDYVKDKRARGTKEINELLDIFRLCLPEDVERRLMELPTLAIRVLVKEDSRFLSCDQDLLDQVVASWFDKKKRQKRETKPKDPITQKRREMVREWGTKEDLKNLQKLRNLFGRLDRKKIPIPGSQSDSDWMSLLDNPDREQDLLRAKDTLRQDFRR